MKSELLLGSKQGAVVTAKDEKLIHQLPSIVTSSYPVDPRYITPKYHLSRSASVFLNDTLLTYANGDFASRYLLQWHSHLYMERMRKYYEHVEIYKSWQWHDRNHVFIHTKWNGGGHFAPPLKSPKLDMELGCNLV